MKQRSFYSPVLILTAIALLNCAHVRVKPERVFEDPNAGKRVEYLEGVLQEDPTNHENHMELGKIFLSEYMIEDAIWQFENVLNIDPTNIEAYQLLSIAIQRLPNPDLSRAYALLEEAIHIDPGNASLHLGLAHIDNEQGKSDEAIVSFRRVIELSDEPVLLISAHLGLMAIFESLDESEKAEEHYQMAYEIYPGVEEMIKQAEINSITSPPEYSGEEFRGDDGIHPPLEERIKLLQDIIAEKPKEEIEVE